MENSQKIVLTEAQKAKLLENLKPILEQKNALTKKILIQKPVVLSL